MTKKIFIRLLEGTEILVPVEAKPINDNQYEIESNEILDLEEDATSIWEFLPGDVVRCEDIHGKLVASELLKSTFPNRRIYQLIFKIVKSLGNMPLSELMEFRKEINTLCFDKTFKQREHPIVKTWLIRNCASNP